MNFAQESQVDILAHRIGMDPLELRLKNYRGQGEIDPVLNEEIRSNGFFITGDLGTMDEEGRVSIVGRSKDLVISGGYNVYPKEVESVLDDMDSVVESAVIGVPHADFGEAVVAVVVPEGEGLEASAISDGLADQVAKFKQPKAVEFIDVIPRNPTGKILKRILREQYPGPAAE